MKREYPSALEAERAILGQILQDPALLRKEAAPLDPRWMFNPQHARLLQAMRSIVGRGEVFDLVTLPGHLDRMGITEAVGGIGYVMQLPDHAPSTANAPTYLAEIRDAFARRETLAACEIVARAARTEPVDEMRETIHARLRAALAAGQEAGDAIGYDDLVGRVDDEIQAAHDARAQGRVAEGALVTTGFPELDRALGGGMRRGSCYVVAARPGVGKTAVMLELARSMALESLAEHRSYAKGRPPEHALLLSLEMTELEVAQRALSRESGIPHQRIASGTLRAEEWEAYYAASETVSSLPIRVWHRRGATVPQLVGKIHGEAARRPLRLVALDYAQIVRVRGDLRYDQLIGQMVQELSAACSEVGAVFVLLAQIGRAGVADNKPPQMHHIKESGDIEQEAYAVLLLDRPGLRGEDYAAHHLHIHLPKIRSGQPCALAGCFYGDRMQITIDGPLSAGPPPPPEAGRPWSGRSAAKPGDPIPF